MNGGTGTVRWVDLGLRGFEAVVAHFDGSPGERAVLVRGDGRLSPSAQAALEAAGFRDMPGPRTVFARAGGGFTLAELRAAFPRAAATTVDVSATRARFRGASPFAPAAPAPADRRDPAPAPVAAPEAPGPSAAAEPPAHVPADAPPVARRAPSAKAAARAAAHEAARSAAPERVNRFQSRYVPASRVGTPVAMVPQAMASATAAALRRVEEAHGPIDNFVAGLMGMSPTNMGKAVSPEQVDAVGMAVAAMHRGRSFILADQTGLGKGRVLAATALAAARMGKTVIFVTEKANLFSDFWRDVVDIGAAKALGTPFILNEKARVVDVASVNGDILFESARSDVIRRTVKSGVLPKGCRVLMLTHSQLNRVGSAKAAFVASVAEDAVVIVDEAHNAVGDSNTAKALKPALERAWGSIRSSATFARTAVNLLSYGDVLPPSLRGEDAAETLAKGGNALAEAMAQYLAEDGVLIRREHDLSGISIDVVTDLARMERNRSLADALAPILARMAKLARTVGDEAELRNEEAKNAGGKSAKELWYTANFGSRLSPLIRQFVTALSVELCVERCVDSLLAGEKPVIVIESTMESLMRELSSEGGADDAESPELETLGDVPDPDPEDAAAGDGAEGTRPPDFRAALTMVLDRMMMLSVKRPNQDPEKFAVEEPFAVREAREIAEMIEAFPDLSLSPIDDVRDRIEAEGRRLFEAGRIAAPWRADEISARRMRVRDGLYEALPPQDRNATIVAFNGGPIDALVITRAASTGLSLHASERAADQRRRRMIELQIAKNVVERIQFWGRVNRRGQVSIPGFETLCTGLPLQMRIMAMENRKVEALSANVSASADNASAMDVPDMIDSVGNDVARRILEDRPKLAERMCVAMKVDPEEADQELYFVNKLLQRLPLLSSDEQDEVFEQLRTDYADALAGLAAKGRSPRGLRELEGEWTEVAREPYEPGVAADGAVFGRPVDLVTMEATVTRAPLSSQAVRDLVAASRARLGASSGNAAGPYFEAEVRAIKASRRKVLNAALSGRLVSVDSALADKYPNAVKTADARLTELVAKLRFVQPGGRITVPADEGELREGVVVDVRAPDADEAHLPGRWAVRYAIAGDDRPREVSLATVFRDPSYTLHQTRSGEVPTLALASFDAAPSGSVRETRRFLDGNLVKAVIAAADAGAGSMVTVRGPGGTARRSVLISRRGLSALFDRSRRARDATEAVSVLDSGRPLFTDHRDRRQGARLVPDGPSSAILELPKGKAGRPFDTDAVLALAGNLRTFGDIRSARVPRDRLARLAEALMEAGHGLHFDPPLKKEEQSGPGLGKRRSFGAR